MKKISAPPQDKNPIRKRAEEILETRKPDINSPIYKADMKRLIHDLQVHQIELEIQNEELMNTRKDLEESLFQYIELYDFAPVGYLTLNKDRIIVNINLNGARILGHERSVVLNTPLSRYVADYSCQVFDAFLSSTAEKTGSISCSICLERPDFKPCMVQIKAIADSLHHDYRLVIIDITQKEEAEKKLRESEEKYRIIIENMQDIFFRIDMQDMITDINPAGVIIAGYSSPEELINSKQVALKCQVRKSRIPSYID
jgi:PAS domain-containing protein